MSASTPRTGRLRRLHGGRASARARECGSSTQRSMRRRGSESPPGRTGRAEKAEADADGGAAEAALLLLSRHAGVVRKATHEIGGVRPGRGEEPGGRAAVAADAGAQQQRADQRVAVA